jgi:membrane protein YdbS with pleckstrin-like domain
MPPPVPETALRATFNPLIRPYLVVTIGLQMAVTVVLLPVALLWFCGLGQWWARHYFHRLECELSTQTLRYRKGILFQVEKTIPLENIQDVTFIEGPVLKRFNLSILKFETAGQSAGQAHDMKLVGIERAHDFRSQILARREVLKRGAPHRVETPAAGDESLLVLKAILLKLGELETLMKSRRE